MSTLYNDYVSAVPGESYPHLPQPSWPRDQLVVLLLMAYVFMHRVRLGKRRTDPRYERTGPGVPWRTGFRQAIRSLAKPKLIWTVGDRF
jgi:hypothetical protein